MKQLAAFAKKWSGRAAVGCWLGDIGAVGSSERVVEIARKAGYSPQSVEDFFQISRRTAARVLAHVQKESLAYGERRYREGLAREMEAMLGELGPDAQFWSSSRHSDFEADTPAFTPDNASVLLIVRENFLGCPCVTAPPKRFTSETKAEDAP